MENHKKLDVYFLIDILRYKDGEQILSINEAFKTNLEKLRHK